ncbi:MAG: CotH kinase family protein [Clostridia bacterium]|nr:CotH kinase family protein [Clostridia bacterium]
MKKLLLILFATVAIVLGLCACNNECAHSWRLATCDAPKTCASCGVTEGNPLEHSWREPNCLSPKTCKNCGLTEGEAFGHNWTTLNCAELKRCTRCGIGAGITEHQWNTDVCLEIPNCTVCGIEGEAIKHSYNNATCEEAKTCQKCGDVNGAPLGHNWQVTTCKEPKICKNCGESTTKDLPHNWIFRGCDEQRICSVCIKSEGSVYGHTWIDASCYLPKHCNKCDVTEGEPKGHSWNEATCAAPKTCTVCRATEGKALEHKWTLVKTIDSTCEEGKKIYSCDACQGEMIFELPATIGYHLCDENGACTQCTKSFDTSELTLEAILITNEYSVERCGVFTSETTTSKIYKPVTYADIGMPVVDLGGTLPTYKNNYQDTVKFVYNSGDLNFSCYAQINVQGASSAGKPKKNFNIKLIDAEGNKNKVKLVDAWGKESKYCMKANYIDYSQARNVVSAQIFGEIVRSRNDELYDLPNGGAIDGYPILVYNNGEYQGIYTLNIPKDKWMFDMKDSDEKNQAIFMTNTWNDAVSFRQHSTSGFELEYASNEDSLIDNNTQWAYDSMLRLIDFVMNNDGEAFKNGIHEYADVDKCIDSIIYTFFICADDNTSKNIIWVTLDGKVWFSSMYDMDGTWGMRWNGNIEFNENTHPISALKDGMGLAPERNPSNYNLLWQKIYLYFFDRVCERYMELRQEILTLENITEYFTAFFNAIPDIVREAEDQKWSVPSQHIDHLEQILTFAEKRLEVFDKILIPEGNQA